MAINKKGSKVAAPGYPSRFVELVESAAKAYTVSQWFRGQYDGIKKQLGEYLEDANCPVTINVGQKGASPRIEGVGTLIVTQPERLDNQSAIAEVVRLLKAEIIRPDDLIDLISSVNKEGLSRVTDVSAFIKRDANGDLPVEMSVRVDKALASDIVAGLDAQCAPKLAA